MRPATSQIAIAELEAPSKISVRAPMNHTTAPIASVFADRLRMAAPKRARRWRRAGLGLKASDREGTETLVHNMRTKAMLSSVSSRSPYRVSILG